MVPPFRFNEWAGLLPRRYPDKSGSLPQRGFDAFPTDFTSNRAYPSSSSAAALRQASVAERPVVLPPVRGVPVVPIRQFLDGRRFDPETIRVMGLAFEITRAPLHVADADDAATEIIARKITDLAQKGEHDPELLSELALAGLRAPKGASK
jgi:hypothetical protein